MSCNCTCDCDKQQKTVFEIGDEVHGFCGGYFGRDDYYCKKVEARGYDYIVFRYLSGGVTMYSGKDQETIYRDLSKYMKPDDHCDCNDW